MKYHQLAKFERKDVILAYSLNVFSFYFTSRKVTLAAERPPPLKLSRRLKKILIDS